MGSSFFTSAILCAGAVGCSKQCGIGENEEASFQNTRFLEETETTLLLLLLLLLGLLLVLVLLLGLLLAAAVAAAVLTADTAAAAAAAAGGTAGRTVGHLYNKYREKKWRRQGQGKAKLPERTHPLTGL